MRVVFQPVGERQFSEAASQPTGWTGWTLEAWLLIDHCHESTK